MSKGRNDKRDPTKAVAVRAVSRHRNRVSRGRSNPTEVEHSERRSGTTPPRLSIRNVGAEGGHAVQCGDRTGRGGADAGGSPLRCAAEGVGAVLLVTQPCSERTDASANEIEHRAQVELRRRATFRGRHHAPGTCTTCPAGTRRFVATAPWLASATVSWGIRHLGSGKDLKSLAAALAFFVRTPHA
jgi:hypothetical protein